MANLPAGGPGAYAAILAAAAQGRGGVTGPMASPAGASPPVIQPGGPTRPPISNAMGAPAPTGAGAMPSGTGKLPSKAAIGGALSYLREVKDHYPSAAGDIDTMIAKIQALAGPTPGAQATMPAPGAPPAAAPPGPDAAPPGPPSGPLGP